jgi:glycosyltransferase involved in cell wall biosynthesis
VRDSSSIEGKPLRVLATVTFNPNQLRAHLEPLLLLPEVEEVILVADEHAPPLPKLRSVVPPKVLTRVFSRAGAKLIVCLVLALRERPDWIVGFNLIPHGINAIIAGRIARTRSLYYMIGGPVEWEGGGLKADNRLLTRLSAPKPRLEAFLIHFIRRATGVAVMGETGRRSLVAHGIDGRRIHVIPASVDPSRFQRVSTDHSRAYDVLTIGSLIERKRTQDLISAVAQLIPSRPHLRVAIVGVGPREGFLRNLATRLGIQDAIEFLGFCDDTPALLRDAKVFVLTSRFEGLSIALGEAMTSGVPVVATDVGETSSLVSDGVNGFLVPVGRPDLVAYQLGTLLDDDALRARMGVRASADAQALLSPLIVAERYRVVLAGEVL